MTDLTTIFQRPTANGRVFDYARVTTGMIAERDLAHHLSRRECWAGNTDFASYSVAQHCLVTVSACRHPASRIYALLQSAPAAYLGWIDAPLRLWLVDQGADIMGLEHRILTAIFSALGVQRPNSEIFADVHEAEQRAQATEWRDVVKSRAGDWSPKGKPLAAIIRYKPQPKVEEEYFTALDRALQPFRNRAA